MRVRSVVAVGAVVALSVSSLNCGQEEVVPEVVSSRGVSVEIPPGWQAAASPVSRVSDPREVLAVGTFELRYEPMNCDPFAGAAQRDVGADGAFVMLQESAPYAPEPGHRQFGVRPVEFGPDSGDPGVDCSGGRARVQWIPFRDGGRYFFALVALGPSASEQRRAETYGVLDSLVVDPSVRPDWEGSP